VKTTVPPREDVEPAVDGDADAHRNQGCRNALCALPSYTSGIQEMDPPAGSRPRKISKFRSLRHCCQSYHSRHASPHYYGIITSYKSVLHGIPPQSMFHQQQHQHRPQIFISNLRQVPRSSAIREPPHSRGVEQPHFSNHYWSLKRQKLSSIPRCLRYPSSRSRSSRLLFNFDLHSRYSRATAHRLSSTKHSLVPPLFFAHSQSHSRLSLLSSALSRHLVAIAIRLVQPSIYLWSSSCCPTDHVTLSLSLYGPIVAAAVISVSQVILSLSSCRCLRTSSLSSSTFTSRITASKPRRSSAPREGVLS